MNAKSISKKGPQRALIYCRVSDKKQKLEGHGLDSQEHRCRQYADMHSYDVEAVFPDDITGEGDFMKRPGMKALLAYLDARPDENYVIIFDDLKRFSRDREYHFLLRTALASRGAQLECLNFRFEDTPEGEFIETIFAAQGQLERKQNQRQVIQKMRARIENGYWCFAPVLGYTYAKVPGHGKMIVKDEPNASIVADALEGYAHGRFQNPNEVRRFLETFPSISRGKYGNVPLNTVIDMLDRVLYTGHISVPKWNIHFHPGKHEPLISLETWHKIQERRKGTAIAPARKDTNADFPLRNFILCATCEKPMTAAWSKGKKNYHAYYFCHQKSCSEFRKSIRRDDLEGAFEDLLQELHPSPKLLRLAKTMLRDIWETRRAATQTRQGSLKAELSKIEKSIDQLMDRIVDADNDKLVKAYEERITRLETEKALITEKTANASRPAANFETAFRTAFELLSNPWKLWESGLLSQRRMLLRLVFPTPVAYDREAGIRTPEIAQPFRVLRAFCTPRCGVVGPEGLEPPTKPL